MSDEHYRRTVLAGSIALLGGCATAGSPSNRTDDDRSGSVVLDSIVLHNRYEPDPPEEGEETDATDSGVGVALLVELDGDPVQWSEHALDPGQEYVVHERWPSTAGAWTVHAREVHTGKLSVRTEWPSIDLEDVVQGDDRTSVAVDVTVTETGRIELDATPTS